MNVKRTKLLILLCVFIISAITVVSAVAHTLNAPKSPHAVETAKYSGVAPKYILKIYNGCVAVFLPANAEPEYVTETHASVLPAADRLLLDAGIAIFTEEQLTGALEDYGS